MALHCSSRGGTIFSHNRVISLRFSACYTLNLKFRPLIVVRGFGGQLVASMTGFSLLGVNLSGAEYNPGSTLEGTNYVYPSDAEIDYYASKGMNVIRLPFLLERVEPVAGGPLSTTELGYIDQVVAYAATKGIDVILDPHDYGYEYGTVIGTTSASNTTFANFWGELAAHFASTPNVMFGLMNEPNAVTPTQWLASANAAIAAIRAAGATSQQILVPGTYWDTASSWVSSGNAQVLGSGIVDPSHNFAFEVHQYLDAGQSGTSSTVVSTTIGVERLTAITQWAEATGNKLFLGEFGVASDSTSLSSMNKMLSYMAQHTDVWEGGTYWAGGPWWGSYMYSIEPTNGVDKPQMGVLDQYISNAIASSPSVTLTQTGGANFYLNNSSSGATAELQYGGTPVVAGEFGAWTLIGAVAVTGGYEVAWSLPGGNQYSIWTTDSSGKFVSQIDGLTGTSLALEAAESVFGQDLNGDGVIGPRSTVIHVNGSTSLTQVADEYFLSGGSNPALSMNGAPVVAGEFGAWTPVGAVAVTGGYEVAWSLPGGNQYSIWTTDSSGKFVSQIDHLTGTSLALYAVESVFGQDLNGDGVVGPQSTLIHVNGSTSLTQVGNEYFLSGGSNPALSMGGAPVVAGEFGAWTPVGAVAVTGGYEVAWSLPGGNQYSIWTADSSGTFLSQIDHLTGTSLALYAAESVLGQDLNGDGVIGPQSTLIHVNGSTSLTQVRNEYFLSGGSNPALSMGGAPVVAGEFGAWTPVGAVAVTGGYEVAWSLPGGNQYSIWTTDSSGNFVSQIDHLTGTSLALQAAESVFGQDLNGDGVIGPVTPIATGATVELASGVNSAVKFAGATGTLVLDQSTTYTGQVYGLSGNGSLVGSDHIDLKDIVFASGVSESFSGNTTGGTLTVTDGQNHTTHIALVGNYVNSTFSLSSDGHGGTIVIDPVTSDQASGILSFGAASPLDTYSVAVTPASQNFAYGGNFAVDAPSSANGQEVVGFHFNFDASTVNKEVSQTYDVSLVDHQAQGTSQTTSQIVTVTIGGPGNESFVFHPGIGTNIVVNATSTDTYDLRGFASMPTTNQVSELLHEAQTGQTQAVFSSTNEGHDTMIDLGNHDSITLSNVQLATLHANNFIIG
jgi:aryl-phospho-beta-D-glucosidase BglC (GH1 family)